MNSVLRLFEPMVIVAALYMISLITNGVLREHGPGGSATMGFARMFVMVIATTKHPSKQNFTVRKEMEIPMTINPLDYLKQIRSFRASRRQARNIAPNTSTMHWFRPQSYVRV